MGWVAHVISLSPQSQLDFGFLIALGLGFGLGGLDLGLGLDNKSLFSRCRLSARPAPLRVSMNRRQLLMFLLLGRTTFSREKPKNKVLTGLFLEVSAFLIQVTRAD